nr:hypothetical protein [uncultured Duganella sp.]
MMKTNSELPQPAKKTHCIFCDKLLTKTTAGPARPSDRAKEHVLKKSFITALGHDATKVHTDIYSGPKLIGQRSPYAQGYLAGEVCRECNNGWMDTLDISIAHIVLAAARSPAPRISFTNTEAVALSRWLLKMACVFESTDSRERRHIPADVRLAVKRPGYLPANFVAFYGKLKHPARKLGPAIMDFWPISAQTPLAITTASSQFKRLKFGVQYNHAIFGCAYVDEPGIAFAGVPGVHNKIFSSSDTSFKLSEDPFLLNLMMGPPKFGFADTDLNRFLAAVKADKPIAIQVAQGPNEPFKYLRGLM